MNESQRLDPSWYQSVEGHELFADLEILGVSSDTPCMTLFSGWSPIVLYDGGNARFNVRTVTLCDEGFSMSGMIQCGGWYRIAEGSCKMQDGRLTGTLKLGPMIAAQIRACQLSMFSHWNASLIVNLDEEDLTFVYCGATSRMQLVEKVSGSRFSWELTGREIRRLNPTDILTVRGWAWHSDLSYRSSKK